MHSHWLGSTTLSRFDLSYVQSLVLYCHNFFRGDVGNNLSSDLPKSPCPVSDQWVTKGPWHDPLPEGMNHQSLILSLEFYHERSKPVQEVFKGSPCICFTLKRSKGTDGWARLTMNCSLNKAENWSKEVMWPSGRPTNDYSIVPVNVPMNNLQCMASIPPRMIIRALNAMRWASGSSVPIKKILGIMKLVGTMTSMIACENGMGRALSSTVRLHSFMESSPSRCRSLRNSSLSLHSSSLLARDTSSFALNWSCLSTCSAQTSAMSLSWSTLDAATISWRVLAVPMSCCRVGPGFIGPHGGRQMFLLVDLIVSRLQSQALAPSISVGICSSL